MDDVDAEESGECGEDGKKHVCPTCGKRFNRPSSLRIHVNTHTGATPFRCPYPNCNRAFNVNSNMRRHYRNHGHPTYNTSPSTSQAMPMHTYPAPSPPSPTILPHASWNGHGHAPPMHNFPPPAPYPPQSYLMAGPHSQRGGISRAWTPPAVGSWSAPPKRYSESDVRSERR
ncbi:hypothetical protein FB45DRAFT_756261 [Roridomyces roridus]|uniref:C2H2-type domain-containing protein n=1 Tax=Roridomyces roridus TaxID=1738132 RepID=A0AAD7FGQ7_9AGAR|nr:hypothetical protein FB45DRAFT_756261 [Roridomyces roridus]